MNLSTVVLLIAGLLFLIIGAEALVRGASKLAAAFGISPITVLTLAILVAREVRLHRRGGSLFKPATVPVADNLVLTAADDQRPA